MTKGSCVCGEWTYEYEGEPAASVSLRNSRTMKWLMIKSSSATASLAARLRDRMVVSIFSFQTTR